ncbi:MAG: pyrroline-5-carboxylate reductase [Elusimicrobiota bacterium]
MSTTQVTIIGCGKMGEALIQSLFSKPEFSLKGVEKDGPRREKLSGKYDFPFYEDLEKGDFNSTDIFILAVKPQTIVPPLKKLKDILEVSQKRGHKYQVVSIAAGIKIEFIENILGRKKNYSLIRVMPNTPALAGAGFSALSCGRKVNNREIKKAESIFKQLGKTVIIDEHLMDTVTAVSGSGPAYFFLMAEILKEFAVENGIDKEKARTMAARTAYGAGKLMENSDKSIKQLRKDVTSPGGTTEAALNFLYKNKFDKIFKKAVKKARDRSVELSDISEKKE